MKSQVIGSQHVSRRLWTMSVGEGLLCRHVGRQTAVQGLVALFSSGTLIGLTCACYLGGRLELLTKFGSLSTSAAQCAAFQCLAPWRWEIYRSVLWRMRKTQGGPEDYRQLSWLVSRLTSRADLQAIPSWPRDIPMISLCLCVRCSQCLPLSSER